MINVQMLNANNVFVVNSVDQIEYLYSVSKQMDKRKYRFLTSDFYLNKEIVRGLLNSGSVPAIRPIVSTTIKNKVGVTLCISFMCWDVNEYIKLGKTVLDFSMLFCDEECDFQESEMDMSIFL